MRNTYKNYITGILLMALVFMPFLGINFSTVFAKSSIVSGILTKQTIVNVTPAAISTPVSVSSSVCNNLNNALFNLNQSADCLSKISINLQTSYPIYSVVVGPFTKILAQVSVISLWFTNNLVANGFNGLPIILTALLALLLLALLGVKKNLVFATQRRTELFANDTSLSLLQVFRC